MAKFHPRNFRKPTPDRFKRLGSALVEASQGIAIPAVLADYKWLAAGVLIAGWLGKILTAFFAEDPQQPPCPTPDDPGETPRT